MAWADTRAFLRRCSDSLRWRAAVWRSALRVRPVVKQLTRMKADHPGRPLCGILLIEHIGDIIACEPIVRQLKDEQPDALIVWITKKQYTSLVSSHPHLDAVLSAETMLDAREIIRSGVFDSYVDLHVNRKPTEVRDLLYPKRWGDLAIDASNYYRHGSLLRSLSLGAGWDARLEGPNIYIPAETVAAVDKLSLPDRFVAIHTTSTFPQKDWLPARWCELVSYLLSSYDTHVVEVGLRSSIELDHPRFASLCGRLSLLETAEVVRRSSFFIGIDSAPAHMANAWARPGLVMFGKYPSPDFNPFEGFYAANAEDVILRHPEFVRDFAADDVVGALEASKLWQSAHGSHRRAVEAPQTSYR
jgi:lipopolysaccharide heptosyltransferase III